MRGFSLVECIAASALCALGLMALATTSRATIALTQIGRRAAGSAVLASARFATLRGGPCAAQAGEALGGGYREQWSVTTDGRTRAATIVITWTAAGGPKTAHFQAVLPCQPAD